MKDENEVSSVNEEVDMDLFNKVIEQKKALIKAQLLQDSVNNRISQLQLPSVCWEYSLIPTSENKLLPYPIIDSHKKVSPSREAALVRIKDYVYYIHDQKRNSTNIFIKVSSTEKNWTQTATVLAGLVVINAAYAGYNCQYVHFVNIASSLDSVYESQDEITKWYAADFLIIDHIRTPLSSSVRMSNNISDLLLERKKNNKPTILISNLEYPTICHYWSESLLDYFEESNGDIINISLDDSEGRFDSRRFDLDDFVGFIQKEKTHLPNPHSISFAEIQLLTESFKKSQTKKRGVK